MDDLTPKEQEYLQLLKDGTKLNDDELFSMFGNDFVDLKNNLTIRRLATEEKVKKNKRKALINDFKLEETVKIIPLALKTLVHIMQHGKEHNQLAAAQTIVKPTISYLEKQGMTVASIEFAEGLDDEIKEIMIKIDKQDVGL